jgi:hypothetical protein
VLLSVKIERREGEEREEGERGRGEREERGEWIARIHIFETIGW